MNQTIANTLREKPIYRWTALVLLSSMMFFSYMFVDVMSPLQSLLETNMGWNPETYGKFASSEYFLNVFAFFLIFAGVILDKLGIRFTAILSGVVMVVGASIKYYAVSEGFAGSGLETSLNSFLDLISCFGKTCIIWFYDIWMWS